MIASATYRFQSTDITTDHDLDVTQLLHDYIDDSTNLDMDALVASGDCFVTLASQLDEISELMETEPEVVRPQIEQIVRTLLYMQRFYKPVRKYPKR
ncbi:MAG: hypothetical protein AAB436_01755 [Patescibacteria group bacterium]